MKRYYRCFLSKSPECTIRTIKQPKDHILVPYILQKTYRNLFFEHFRDEAQFPEILDDAKLIKKNYLPIFSVCRHCSYCKSIHKICMTLIR